MMNQNIWCLVSLAPWDVVLVPKLIKCFRTRFYFTTAVLTGLHKHQKLFA